MAEHIHWKKTTNPNYLGSYAFEKGKDLIVKVADVKVETVQNAQGSEVKNVLYFDGDVKPLILNTTNMKAIEKAILMSDVGITPANDGQVIRLVFPQLTEERRRELCKQVMKMAEEAKVAVRNIRRDANDAIKKMQKDSEMTEDEAKSSEKSVQDLTDKYIKLIDAAATKKQNEVMAI